jgi:hypothetical protein
MGTASETLTAPCIQDTDEQHNKKRHLVWQQYNYIPPKTKSADY